MNKLILFAFTVLTGLVAQAQSPVTESRKVAAFTKIEVRSAIKVILSQTENTTIRVVADSQSSMENVITESDGNTLRISLRNNSNTQPQRIKVYVAQKDITGIKAVAGASVKTTEEFKANGLAVSLASGASFKGYIISKGAVKLDAAGGSNFDGIVLTDSFYADVKGGSVLKIAGTATNANITATTGATCLAANFKCENATVDARRTSSVVINVKEKIHASADETASVTYYGNPEKATLGTDSYAVKRIH